MTAPSDVTAERALLAVCLSSPAAFAVARRRVAGPDFVQPVHEQVWNTMTGLARQGRPVDAITVHTTLVGTAAHRVIPDLVTDTVSSPAHVEEYADLVRGRASMRRAAAAARRVLQAAEGPRLLPGLLADAARQFAALRDSSCDEDSTALSWGEATTLPEEPYDWLVPGILEAGDRWMLTGEEGLGKSHLLRQFATHLAGGLHPFTLDRVEPKRAYVIDCENGSRLLHRRLRRERDFVMKHGDGGSDTRLFIDVLPPIDITRDKDLSRLLRHAEAQRPDLIVIGPLYHLTPGAIQTDDEAAPVLAALDTLRLLCGSTLLVEAHAGHSTKGAGKVRNLRPRGSSALLGWPEFGLGLARSDFGPDYADLVPWRGSRDERDWPGRLRSTRDGRWVPDDTPE